MSKAASKVMSEIQIEIIIKKLIILYLSVPLTSTSNSATFLHQECTSFKPGGKMRRDVLGVIC